MEYTNCINNITFLKLNKNRNTGRKKSLNNKRLKKSATKRKKKMKKWPIITLIVILISVYGLIDLVNKTREPYKNYENISKEEFINKIESQAIKEYNRSGILPSITISQAILESNWGNSKLTREANNLFGIKADKSWYGPRVSYTTEEYNGEYIIAEFRKYESWSDSIEDHTNFLIMNKRYKKNGLFSTGEYKKQAQALENAGYATTTNSEGKKVYAEKLIGVIESNGLNKIDAKAKN